MTRVSAEQLKGNTEALVLAALNREALHGYAIARRIEELTDSYLSINEGSLYPTLHRLEQAGTHRVVWARQTLTGTPAPSGRYLARIIAQAAARTEATSVGGETASALCAVTLP